MQVCRSFMKQQNLGRMGCLEMQINVCVITDSLYCCTDVCSMFSSNKVRLADL